ncbi:hypothetical protein GF385_02495 [Candidatus Dependentiae bacterium]|nr:hypothetical protein [Candidatus Dependentiae bacterium]
MKKIILASFLALSLGISQTKADISNILDKDYDQKIKTACIASKLINSYIGIGGTILSIPSIYLISKYFTSKVFKKKEKNGKFVRFIKSLSKFSTNMTSTILGTSIIAYFLKTADFSQNIMNLLGYGNFLEKVACNNIIWPNFKEEFFG